MDNEQHDCHGTPECRCFHCAEVAQHARKQIYEAMLTNARTFLKQESERFIPLDEARLTIFDLSAALGIFMCSTKESALEDILGLINGKS